MWKYRPPPKQLTVMPVSPCNDCHARMSAGQCLTQETSSNEAIIVVDAHAPHSRQCQAPTGWQNCSLNTMPGGCTWSGVERCKLQMRTAITYGIHKTCLVFILLRQASCDQGLGGQTAAQCQSHSKTVGGQHAHHRLSVQASMSNPFMCAAHPAA